MSARPGPATSTLERGTWPWVIIGGGPSAILQVTHLLRTGTAAPSDILMIGSEWGAPGMGFLGSVRLQSYITELSLGSLTHSLSQYAGPGFLQPTGTEYDRYARDVLESTSVRRCQGHVEELRRDSAGFEVVARTPNGASTIRSKRVVVATGSRERHWPAILRETGAVVPCDRVFKDVMDGRISRYASRNVLIVGSGNSAMQAGSLLAPISCQVTILANKYLGAYPRDTLDRYAWRAASQLTHELVVKGSRECWAGDGTAPCVRFFVYDSLSVDGGTVVFSYSAAANQHQMGRCSSPPHHPHIRATAAAGTEPGWREEWPLAGTTVVWATGRDPVYPPSSLLSSLPTDRRGVVMTDERGQAPVPGLYLTGACAGQRAVNEMMSAPTGTAQQAYQDANPPSMSNLLIPALGVGDPE
jgi:hypothetical protein